MAPDKDVAAVRDWLLRPAREAGIHLADEADGWEFRSYRELAEQSWSIAALMREHGLAGGEGACVVMPTGFACTAAFYAVWACGGVFTPIAPPMFGDLDQIVAHIAAILTAAAPRLVVTAPEFEDLVRRAAVAAGRRDEPLVIGAELPQPPAERELGAPAECALLQFTSGSTGTPRGVRVSWRNLANNIAMISGLIDWRHGEAMVSWLPLYHDMGLVGAFLTTVTNQGDLYLMRPDQFVRDPARWLRAMASAQHSPSPSFALGYVAHRVRPEEIADLDLSGWRTLAVGSEPVEVADLQAFAELTGPRGFSMDAYTLAYGLAEATLMVTSSARRRPITALRLDTPNLRFGRPVGVLGEARLDDTHGVDGAGWITGLGYSTPESTVRAVDEVGRELPDGVLGELVVVGDSVAMGYTGDDDGGATRIANGELYTGDAGFLYRGEVFVLGRMGSSLKVRGRSVFMEDIESRVAGETGLTKGKLAAVALTDVGAPGIALFAEAPPGAWTAQARKVLRGELGPAAAITIITGPRGTIRRTSSGKPRRRHLWQLFRDGGLAGVQVHEADGTTALTADSRAAESNGQARTVPDAQLAAGGDDRDVTPSSDQAAMPSGGRLAAASGDRAVVPCGDPAPVSALPTERVRQLLDAALESTALPDDSAVLFEGSLAEGFGNEGSDVDFLAVVPGTEELPTLPTVLFIDGRRVEVRTRSVAQMRRQLERAATGVPAELEEDLLNRCQRFLRATVVRPGAVDLDGMRALLPHDDFRTLMSRWWTARAVQALRYAVALRALRAADEANEWAMDGLLQAVKAWAARHGETYLETKWLPRQLDRIGRHEFIDRYRELSDPTTRTFQKGFGGDDLPEPATDGHRHAASVPSIESDVSSGEAKPTAPDPGAAFLPDSEARQLAEDATWQGLWRLVADLGIEDTTDDPHRVLFARRPAVTTWTIGGRIHVVRDDRDVFALSDTAARAWRSVVFKHSVRDVLARAPRDIATELAEFVRLGLVGLQWRAAGPIEPALAMCKPAAPYTPVPSAHSPALGLTGAARDDAIATLSPLPARRFTECALHLVWSNIVLENAREDLAGAVKNGQGGVADIAAHRLIAMAVRVLLSAFGIHPLPADVAPSTTVARLVPTGARRRTEVLEQLDTARGVRFSELLARGGDTLGGLAVLDDFVASVRTVAGGDDAALVFPASFDSREQWRRTLAIGYDWLRLAAYLDTDLPLDEARDLLTTGGHQPHLRESEPS
ncbi:Acyl-CoA synthetase (AMP-forming)/AMP-acid ligase II [Nocardia amikacinitolerans]|uniref:AMP-binding protein n=1 Tax=Nocardia amikacinitolerans TaxID=756689 RepID=UPI0009FFF39A|nr:AMP-binding protein [Nocardia amikacinitolerans]MCP2318749.1 Acyl-CoA synthetase (AMP-forming)/AMP-acid ligase II [Nocardia amikacinitolerans]